MQGLSVLPAAPGAYIHVKNGYVIVQPDQIVKIPILVWNTGRSAWRLPWLSEVTKDDFNAATGIPASLDSQEDEVIEFEEVDVLTGGSDIPASIDGEPLPSISLASTPGQDVEKPAIRKSIKKPKGGKRK